MKPPFKLPARVTHKNLIDWDDKVICVSLDTSEAERDYILWAVNNAHKMHKRLVKLEQVLKGIGFSDDCSISGADCVDVMPRSTRSW